MREHIVPRGRDRAILTLGLLYDWVEEYPRHIKEGYAPYYECDEEYKGLPYVEASDIRVYYKGGK